MSQFSEVSEPPITCIDDAPLARAALVLVFLRVYQIALGLTVLCFNSAESSRTMRANSPEEINWAFFSN